MASRSRSRTLTDPDEIRRWAEERGAKPAAVRNTESGDDVGIIRLDFPGYSGEGSLEEIDWDEWFEKFDDNNLALIVQDKTAGGERSNFNKIVSRDSIESSSARSSGRSSSRGRRSSSSGSRSSSSRGTRSSSSPAARSSASSGTRSKKTASRASRRPAGARAAAKKAASRASQTSKRSASEGRAKSHRSSRSSGRKAA